MSSSTATLGQAPVGQSASSQPAASPHKAGRFVRTLGAVMPGMRNTADQIESFGAIWDERNELALRSDLPLWVALGDSLAQGVGASSVDRGYVARLATMIEQDFGVMNLSRSGERTNDVIIRQLPLIELLPHTPHLVTCSVGNNDLVRSVAFRSTLRSLGLLIENLPPTTIMATLPERGSLLAKRTNRVIRDACAERDLRVADVGARLETWRGRFARDGFHPNDAGYQVWVDAFAEAIIS